MTYAQKVAAARKFVQRWQGRGQEKSDTHTFWLDLCDSVIGMEHVATTVLFESQTTDRGWIDAVIPDAKTFIEQKSIGVDLDQSLTHKFPDTLTGSPNHILLSLIRGKISLNVKALGLPITAN